MDTNLKKDLYSRPASSLNWMQVFTLRQEFGKSADNLDYENMKGEKCGRDKETEGVSVREMSGCGCVHISICLYLISVLWGFHYLLAEGALCRFMNTMCPSSLCTWGNLY